MTIGKIKLTQEQADAIELYLKNPSNDKAGLINCHASVRLMHGGWDRKREYAALNDLDQSDMARALLIGYEVEEKYEVGNYVLNKHGTIGVIEEIDGINYIGRWLYPTQVIMDCYADTFKRHATPEEIKVVKEWRIWTKIGREVGEFKDGDLRLYKDGEALITRGGICARIDYKNGDLKGIYPTESFISFEDVDEE